MNKMERYLLITLMIAAWGLLLGFPMGTVPNFIGWILIVTGMLRILLIKRKENKQ